MSDTLALKPTGSQPFRIGVGAGFGGDRIEPAVELARFAELDALVFECLAERTISVAQTGLQNGSDLGFDSRILERFRLTLPGLRETGGVAITNAGAANPIGAAAATRELLDDLGLGEVRVAAVTGDDVLDAFDLNSTRILGTDRMLSEYKDRIISANAYTGAAGVLEALQAGASVVIGGRIGDASLFTGAIMHHYGKSLDQLDALAEATLVGHMLECGGQLTGGYFADGVQKRVRDLDRLGFPFADVSTNGTGLFQKLEHEGGELTLDTMREQLYYEIENPREYLTPDLAIDFSKVTLTQVAPDKVEAKGALPLFVPETLKVSVGIDDGYTAIAEITYAGAFAMERAELAKEIIYKRWLTAFKRGGAEPEFYFIGLNSARPWFYPQESPREIRLRVALSSLDREQAVQLCREVEALYTNGPAGGGGVTGTVKETVGIVSALIPADAVQQKIKVM